MSLIKLINNIPSGIAQGLIWGILALGIYITFRVLNESDLTVESSFATGGAVCIVLIKNGLNPGLALFVSFVAGLVCGSATGLIHTRLKIPAILSGILVSLALYPINLHIMGMSSNLALNIKDSNLLISIRDVNLSILVSAIIVVLLIVIMYWYFGTEQGCAIRATGNSNNMAIAQGINIGNMKVLGFALSNGLVALSGGIYSQYNGFADVNMGRGAMVIGLAAIIIGEAFTKNIFKKGCSFYTRLAFAVVGSITYYLTVIFILWCKINSNDLKLYTAIIVMIFLAIPNLKKGRN